MSERKITEIKSFAETVSNALILVSEDIADRSGILCLVLRSFTEWGKQLHQARYKGEVGQNGLITEICIADVLIGSELLRHSTGGAFNYHKPDYKWPLRIAKLSGFKIPEGRLGANIAFGLKHPGGLYTADLKIETPYAKGGCESGIRIAVHSDFL